MPSEEACLATYSLWSGLMAMTLCRVFEWPREFFPLAYETFFANGYLGHIHYQIHMLDLSWPNCRSRHKMQLTGNLYSDAKDAPAGPHRTSPSSLLKYLKKIIYTLLQRRREQWKHRWWFPSTSLGCKHQGGKHSFQPQFYVHYPHRLWVYKAFNDDLLTNSFSQSMGSNYQWCTHWFVRLLPIRNRADWFYECDTYSHPY